MSTSYSSPLNQFPQKLSMKIQIDKTNYGTIHSSDAGSEVDSPLPDERAPFPRQYRKLFAVYVFSFVYLGAIGIAPAALVSIVEIQTHSNAAQVFWFLIGRTFGYTVGSIFKGWIMENIEKTSHKSLIITILINIPALIICNLFSQLWIVVLLWIVIGFASGNIETGISTYLFRLARSHSQTVVSGSYSTTATPDQSSVTIQRRRAKLHAQASLAAILLQLSYAAYGIGATAIPLLINYAATEMGSYQYAMYVLALMGCFTALSLCIYAPPPPVEDRHRKKDKWDFLAFEGKKMWLREKDVWFSTNSVRTPGSFIAATRLLLSQSKMDLMTRRGQRNQLWGKVVVALSAMGVFISAGLQLALNGYATDFTYDYLKLSKTTGRYLNSTYFFGQLIGRFVSIVGIRRMGASSLLMLDYVSWGICGVLLILYYEYEYVLFALFFVNGLAIASVIAASMKFSDEIVGNSGLVSSLYFAAFSVGNAVFSTITGVTIQHFGYLSYPYFCGISSIANAVLFAFTVLLRKWKCETTSKV